MGCPEIPWGFDYPWSFLTKEPPWCSECFCHFSRGFLGSEGSENPCFVWFSHKYATSPNHKNIQGKNMNKNLTKYGQNCCKTREIDSFQAYFCVHNFALRVMVWVPRQFPIFLGLDLNTKEEEEDWMRKVQGLF